MWSTRALEHFLSLMLAEACPTWSVSSTNLVREDHHGNCLIQVCRASEKTWSITRGCPCEPFFVSKVSNGSPVAGSTCHICTVRIYILGCQAWKTFEKPCACKCYPAIRSIVIDPILSITQQIFRCTLGTKHAKKACLSMRKDEKGS